MIDCLLFSSLSSICLVTTIYVTTPMQRALREMNFKNFEILHRHVYRRAYDKMESLPTREWNPEMICFTNQYAFLSNCTLFKPWLFCKVDHSLLIAKNQRNNIFHRSHQPSSLYSYNNQKG